VSTRHSPSVYLKDVYPSDPHWGHPVSFEGTSSEDGVMDVTPESEDMCVTNSAGGMLVRVVIRVLWNLTTQGVPVENPCTSGEPIGRPAEHRTVHRPFYETDEGGTPLQTLLRVV